MSLSITEREFLSALQKVCQDSKISINFEGLAKVGSGLYVTRVDLNNELDPNHMNMTVEMILVCPGDLVAEATDINITKEIGPKSVTYNFTDPEELYDR